MVWYVIIFLLGLSVGSFLNVVIYRFEDWRTIFAVRSHCPHCKVDLPWYDLIPLLSFIRLGGRCRKCRKPISFQYPLVELVTALLFVVLFWRVFGPPAGGSLIASPLAIGDFILLAIAISFLIFLFVYDAYHYILPDVMVYPLILIGVLHQGITLSTTQDVAGPLLNLVYALLATAGFLGLLALASRGKWMGEGDVKFAVAIAFLVGWPAAVVATLSAFIIGAIIGVFLIATKRKTGKDMVPFGPFLVIGTLLALFYGEEIMKWYLQVQYL